MSSPSSLHPVSTTRAVARGVSWGCCRGGGPQVLLVVPCHRHHHRRCPHPHCTPFPPHEQLLVAAVGGAVLVVVLRHCLSLSLLLLSSSSLSLSCVVVVVCRHHCCVSPFPLCHPCLPLFPSSFHPPSSALAICPPPCLPSFVISTPSSSLPLVPRPSFQPLPRPLLIPTLPYHCWPHSTRDPPHEQWLMRLGVGGLLYDAVMFMAGPVGIVGVI